MKGICLWIVPLLLAGIAAGDEAAEMELAEKRLLGQLLNAFKGRVNGGADEGATTGSDRDPLSKPNVILFVGDDMGYGDLTSYGHPTQEPGFIDQMAAEGMRFTNGYVADTVCTPSRSAFMTGRLPIRIGTYGNTRVFLPWSKTGLPKSEVTIAEAMQGAGYKTGMVGKWHLGINEETSTDGAHLPFNHGFEYVGHMLPFSNSWQCDDTGLHVDFPSTVQCYLYNNATIVSQPYQHRTLTSLFTNDAVDFVDKNSEDPFFLYVSFAHMHNALFSSDEFECSSRRGRYGDNLNEMHDAVKKIMDAVKANDIDDNTVAFFISDHGPHRESCEEGGDASIFRGGKSLSWEGGHRIPYIVHWPGTVAPGVSNELVTTMDIIATAADLGGTSLPTDREYDGKSIREVILEGGSSPHDAFFYYCKDVLMAVRVGDFKAHFFTQDDLSQSGYGETCLGGFPVNDVYYCHDCSGGCVTSHNPPLLFNLAKDPGEAYPLPPSVYAAQLKSVEEAVKEHKAKLVVAEPLLDTFDVTHSNVPCCNPETNCVCNYEQTPGVADCYADTQMLADMLFVP